MANHADVLVSTEFSWEAALALAECSKLVYQNSDTIKSKMTGEWGYDDVTFIADGDTELFVANKDDKVVIAFRGTAGKDDWLNNFKVVGTNDFSFGRVHSGFYQAFDIAKTDLVDTLNNLGSDKRIWVTGHSLGGALSAMCLAGIKETHYDQIQACYTFGQPRVGYSGFVNFIKENYAGRYFRFVNDDDVVPRIPPVYKHVGDLIHFDPEGYLLYPPEDDGTDGMTRGIDAEPDTEPPAMTEEEFEKFLEDNAEGLEEESTRGLLPSVNDHYMPNYINKIKFQLGDE